MTATWTANRTWTAGEIVTASIMNQYVRDNLDWLKTPTASQVIYTTTFTTTSGTFTDVTGATVTLTGNGGGFDVIFVATVSGSAISTAQFALVTDSVTTEAIEAVTFAASEVKNLVIFKHVAALSAGSHTFKIRATVNAGTLTVYGTAGTFYPVLYAVERGG